MNKELEEALERLTQCMPYNTYYLAAIAQIVAGSEDLEKRMSHNEAHMRALPVLLGFVTEMMQSEHPEVSSKAHATMTKWDTERTKGRQ
jgi:hypothetical protein